MSQENEKDMEMIEIETEVETEALDVEVETGIFLQEDEAPEGFLPEADDEDELESLEVADIDGSELDGFESAQIEDLEFIEDERIESIIESILFASDRPVSLASIQMVFKGTTVKKDKIRRAIEALAVEYAGGRRGVTLEEITGGYQIRTKVDNMNFLKRTLKTRTFKLSGPALETLSIVAYKQPVIKMEIDQIRGVESGHLLRALMEKGLVNFEGKAENLPGKPMQYGTTRKFLEIFGLRNLKELPTLSQIDELLPEGIGEEVEEKPTLSTVTDAMATEVKDLSYSQGEEELGLIEEQLTSITTSSEFFEQEKARQKLKRDQERAQDIRDALAVGEEVSTRDKNWLTRFENIQNGSEVSPEEIQQAQADENTTENIIETHADLAGLNFQEETAISEDDIEIKDELGSDLT